MPAKRAPQISPHASAVPPIPKPSPKTSAAPPSSPAAQTAREVSSALWWRYRSATPQRVKLTDAFMAFLVAVGGLQFAYCVLVGNYPFNAFLSGFGATVGQFVLTASLRIQTNPENRREFESVSHERKRAFLGETEG
ncbi:hypothetical protein HO133_004392 [Letharia lupina]|uniref:Dolichyl-diphosphooligosaccharide--protein glycosyltransferase subunit OST2 n=1 Tax=Letharia lupina TaxID=560253 RepID=A0A8H6KZM0_9LECA|nr:uncharacterized protein HO133_004392 [Letharia lupina]KAF6230053.1 hypothetical protein HO133_004392 [Letharia lupina]